MSCLPLAIAQTVSFAEALELALASPGVVLARGQLALAEQQLISASGLVSAQVGSGYSQTWGERTAGGDVTSLNSGGIDPITLSATFNVVPYGPNADSIQRARWQLEAAELALRDAEVAAVITAAQRYLAALRSQQDLDLRTAEVALAELRLEAVRTRLEVGAATESQVLDAELSLSEAQNALANAVRQQAQVSAALSSAVGTTVQSVAGEAPVGSLPAGIDGNLRIVERTDLVRAEHSVLQAELSAASAQRDALPNGSLSMRYSTSNGAQSLTAGASIDTRSYQPGISLSFDPNLDSPTGGGSRSFSLGLSATVPLNSSTPATLEIARLNVEQNRLQATQAREQAVLEVNNSLRELEAARAGAELSRQVLESRQLTLQTMRQRLELGVVTELEAQQAELNVRSAELSLLRSQDAYLLAQMQVLQALALDPTEVF